MTVAADNEIRLSYTGSGTTGPFTTPYFLANSDLKAVKVLISDGTETDLVLDTDYTLTGAGDSDGGALTLVATLSASYRLVIINDAVDSQEAQYPANDPFPSSTHQAVVDRRAMVSQRHGDLLDRAVKLPDGYVGAADATLPTPSGGGIFRWNADADAIEYVDGTPDEAVSTFLQSGSGAVARTWTSKAADIVSVKDFGAVGDGVTDDTVAIQAALTYVAGNGVVGGSNSKTLHIPAGVYCFSEETLRATGHAQFGYGIYAVGALSIVGDGWDQSVLKNTSATGAGLRFGGGHVRTSDFSIDMNGGTGIGFRMGGQLCSASRMKVKNQEGTDYSFIVDGSTLAVIDNIYLENVAFGMVLGLTLPTNYVRLSQITVNQSGDSAAGKAIYCNLCSNVSFDGLTIEPEAGDHGHAIYVTGSYAVSFRNLTFEYGAGTVQNETEYIYITNSKSTWFDNCFLNHNAGSASKIIFKLAANTTIGTTIENVYFASTKDSIVLIDAVTSSPYDTTIRNIVTHITGATPIGIRCSVIMQKAVIEQWYDNSTACTFTLDALNLTVINVDGDIAVTARDKQTFINCNGTFSGTGAPVGSWTASATGPIAATNCVVSFRKEGRRVTLHFPALLVAGNSTNTRLSLSGFIANLRPATAIFAPIALLKDNGTVVTGGVLEIGSAGTLEVSLSTYAAFTSGAGEQGFYGFDVTYLAAA